ncbi:GIY-YIG nuclease family protein [Azohydromonas sediminis]|uniref:GIY-YIG nuclease family protein n=1 Tax=Azohydromonas sediminis TaxID=2259674 RepID=UPI0013C2B76B|nr:GIY-YIG nuclease family protein [Azohydromonas sediminis]
MTTPAETLLSIGFPEPIETDGLRSIAHLFGSSKPRCGIYILILSENRHYIGQAVDVVRRFAQHLKSYGNIQGFSFIPVSRKELNKREKELIFKAEQKSLALVNVVHVTETVGDSDLYDVVSEEELKAWVQNPYAENFNDLDTAPIKLPKSQYLRNQRNINQLRRHALHRDAVILLFLYLDSCIPYPRRTEYSFWSVSCMPSTNSGTWPRLVCVSAGVMELFCIGYYRDPKLSDGTWGFINVASDILYEKFGTESKFAEAHPEVIVRSSTYRDAGQHQVSLTCATQIELIEPLTDSAVILAAATLALRVMRKRSNIYFKFHCPQLVEEAMRYREKTEEEVNAELDEVIEGLIAKFNEKAKSPAGTERQVE